MKILFTLVALCSSSLLAQPYSGPDPSAPIDLDGDGSPEFNYEFQQEESGGDPTVWTTGFGLRVWGVSRFLRHSDARIQFQEGEEISDRLVVYSRTLNVPGRPPRVFYDLGLSGYSSVFIGEWVNTITPKHFDGLREIILGARFSGDDGLHFGWVRLSRVEADMRTPFKVTEFIAHPVPGVGLSAGRRPDLPLPYAQFSAGTLNLTWDPRWGALGLEYSTNLASREWISLPGSFVGVASIDFDGDGAYVRLVWP